MSDDIPKENPLWPKHQIDLVDEAWRKRLEQLSDEQRTKYFLGEWVSEELPYDPKTMREDEHDRQA